MQEDPHLRSVTEHVLKIVARQLIGSERRNTNRCHSFLTFSKVQVNEVTRRLAATACGERQDRLGIRMRRAFRCLIGGAYFSGAHSSVPGNA